MKRFLPAIAISLLSLLPLAPGVHAQAPAATATGEIKELKDVSAELPHDILLGLLSNSTKQATAPKATDVLQQKVAGRVAHLKLKIDRIEKDLRAQQGQDAYRIKAEDAHVREGSVSFKVFVWVHFNVSENAKIAPLKKGDPIEVTGKITVASVAILAGSPTMQIDLSDATVN
jgi:hypothetical protein